LTLLKPHITAVRDKYPSDTVTPVWELSSVIRRAIAAQFQHIDVHTSYARSVEYSTAEGLWTIHMQNAVYPSCKATRILYAPGGTPKQMDLAKPKIPLDVALDPIRLEHFIDRTQPTHQQPQHILLFGLSHSGTLVLKNLLATTASPTTPTIRVSAVYRSETPFLFQKDGHFHGIKQTAAAFAESLLQTPNPLVQFINVSRDTEALLRAYTQCDAIIDATGFTKNTIDAYVDGVRVNLLHYDTTTGALKDAPSAFGFGMAYPSQTPFEGKLYEEAGIESFIHHLDTLVPAILSGL
jgi:hypothetical protein